MRKIVVLFFTLSLCCFTIYANDYATNAKSAYLIEYNSEKALYSKNEDEALYPASMTKMMSLYLIFEAINNNKLKLDDIVSVSEYAAGMGGSQIWLQANEQMSVDDLLKAVCVASANDAVVALAEEVAGSEQEFVRRMNEQAKKWGLVSTNFMNASGLHDDNHYSSAKDMAIIGKHLIAVGGELLFSYTTLYDSYVRENTEAAVWLVNTNKLLRTLSGTDGLKTGYTSQAGYCITLTTSRNNVRLIGVVMKEPTNKIRDNEIRQLMEYGFTKIQTKPLYTNGDLYEVVNIEDGKPSELNVLIGNDIDIKYIENSDYTPMVTYTSISAPIMQGEVIGNLRITSNDGLISETTLLAGNSIQKLNYFDYVKKLFMMFLY